MFFPLSLTPTKKPYTARETLILLSFPMVNHGGHFAQWLRMKLMQYYNLASPNAVYCDVVASRGEGQSVHLNPDPAWWNGGPNAEAMRNGYFRMTAAYQKAGYTVVAPDYRPHMTKSGAIGSGAMAADWNRNFMEAMAQAKVMLFVLNSDYTASQYCLREWQQFQNEHKRRRVSGQNPLRGVVLRFNGDPIAAGMDYTGMKLLTVNRHRTGGEQWGRGMATGNAAHDAYYLNDHDFLAVVNAIGGLY